MENYLVTLSDNQAWAVSRAGVSDGVRFGWRGDADQLAAWRDELRAAADAMEPADDWDKSERRAVRAAAGRMQKGIDRLAEDAERRQREEEQRQQREAEEEAALTELWGTADHRQLGDAEKCAVLMAAQRDGDVIDPQTIIDDMRAAAANVLNDAERAIRLAARSASVARAEAGVLFRDVDYNEWIVRNHVRAAVRGALPTSDFGHGVTQAMEAAYDALLTEAGVGDDD